MADTTAKVIGEYLEQQLLAKGCDAVMSYGELVKEFDDLPPLDGYWTSHPLRDMFGELDIEDASLGRPFRTAIVVSRAKGLPGDGFFKMYVEYRDPKAHVKSDDDRITVHQKELKLLAAQYGHG